MLQSGSYCPGTAKLKFHDISLIPIHVVDTQLLMSSITLNSQAWRAKRGMAAGHGLARRASAGTSQQTGLAPLGASTHNIVNAASTL